MDGSYDAIETANSYKIHWKTMKPALWQTYQWTNYYALYPITKMCLGLLFSVLSGKRLPTKWFANHLNNDINKYRVALKNTSNVQLFSLNFINVYNTTSRCFPNISFIFFAEAVGFEPTERLLAQWFSRPSHSTNSAKLPSRLIIRGQTRNRTLIRSATNFRPTIERFVPY